MKQPGHGLPPVARLHGNASGAESGMGEPDIERSATPEDVESLVVAAEGMSRQACVLGLSSVRSGSRHNGYG